METENYKIVIKYTWCLCYRFVWFKKRKRVKLLFLGKKKLT